MGNTKILPNIGLAVISFVLFGVVFLITSGSANAAYADMRRTLPDDPRGLQFLNMAVGENDAGTGKGAWVPDSYLKVYAQGSGSGNINFGLVERLIGPDKACRNFSIGFEYYKLSPAGNVRYDLGTFGEGERRMTGCTIGSGSSVDGPPGGYNIPIPANVLTASGLAGHVEENIHQALLHIFITDYGTANKSSTIRLTSDANHRIGYAGGYPLTIYPAYTGFAGDQVISSRFRPPCTLSSDQSVTLRWNDDDWRNPSPNPPGSPDGDGNGTENQYDSPASQVKEYTPPDYINPTRNVPQSGVTYDQGPPLNQGQSTFTVRPGFSYEHRFAAVDGGNGIRVVYPYDSGDFFLPCPTPIPAPTSCQYFNHNLQDDTRYRFTIFGTDNEASIAATGGPADGTFVASGAGWTYKTFNQAPNEVQQQIDGTGSNTFSHNYQRPSKDYVIYLERWVRQAGGGWRYYGDAGESGRYVEANCYNATCTMGINNQVVGRPNGVIESNSFDAYMIVNNIGRAPLPASFQGTSLIGYASFQGQNKQGGFTDPALVTGFYGFQAPGGINDDLPMAANLAYPGRNDSMATCSTVVDTYGPFNITPRAEITSIDDEDPRQIQYRAGGANNTGNTVTMGYGSALVLRRPTLPESILDGPNSESGSFGSYDGPIRTFGSGTPLIPGTLQAGDVVCAKADFAFTTGLVGPGNDIPPAHRASPQVAYSIPCTDLSDKPYLRTYGADVMAGAGFATGGVCGVSDSSIKAFQSIQPDRSGSGSQYAALAYNAIIGFTSASLRFPDPPMSPAGLTFGNENPAALGNYANGQTICATDFFSENMFPEENPKREDRNNASAPKINNGLFRDGEQTVYSNPGNPSYQLTIDGTAGSFNNKHTIFVDGDLVITDDIVLNDWTANNPLKAPALAIIVKGDIYIDSNVSRIDGMYVAQPNPEDLTDGGNIYTCTSGNSLLALGNAYISECARQLTINGSFVAKNVQFLRTFKSLRDSAIRERAGDCAGTNDPANSCAAELVRFTPELYLSPPPLYIPPPDIQYQSYGALPPIL